MSDAAPDDARSKPRRRQGRTTRASSIDPAFLPAALEILDRPPSPFGRLLIWTIMLAAALAVIWAMVAPLDIVASAEGRVVPRGQLQSVEAAEAGVVRAIAVREGDVVKAGQPLFELDPTMAEADTGAARTEFAAASLARARADALLASVDGKPPTFVDPPDADPAAILAERSAVAARIAALQQRVAGVAERIAGAQATQDGAMAERQKLIEVLPLIIEQRDARRALAEKGFASRPQLLALEERVVEFRRDIEVRATEITRAEAEMATLRRERQQIIAEFRAQAAAEKAEAEAIVATRQQAVRKAEQRGQFQTLNSPVDGVVVEIAVTTIGEVVEAGARLATIVPRSRTCETPRNAHQNPNVCKDEELIVEALVLNRDIGFIAERAPVVVKLEAFPFTRYGHVEGVVEHISADAIADEARGLVFPVRVRLGESRLRLPERARASALQPGMLAQVEITTGSRTVMAYLLSPIAKATSEAGRER